MLERGAFGAARSFIPGNKSVIDKTIEEALMKHATPRGGGGTGAGLSGILKNLEAFQRWTRTTSERTKYYQTTLSLADMSTETCDRSSHKDLRKAETAKNEKQFVKTIEAIKSFIDPFDVEAHQKLYCLSSGGGSDMETTQDVLRARLDLQELMSYPLTPIPYSIATADDLFAKTNKAKGMELIAKDVDHEPFPLTMKHWSLKMEMQYFTICLRCQGISGELLLRFSTSWQRKPFVIFNTDMYRPNSVKAVERLRRGSAAKLIVGGENTKKPKEWKPFLTNNEIKKQLIEVLLVVWSSDSLKYSIRDRVVILICEGEAY